MNMTHLYSECVAGKFQILCQPFSVLDLFPSFKLMVLQYQVSLFWYQPVQASVETVAYFFHFRALRIWWRHVWRGLLFSVFQVNLLGYGIKINGGIAYIVFQQPINLRYHDVDAAICQIISIDTAAAGEYSYQATPDLLVFFAVLVTIGIEPAQQPIKVVLSWPSFIHLPGFHSRVKLRKRRNRHSTVNKQSSY